MSPVATALTVLTGLGILIVAPEKRLLPLIRDPGTAGILVRDAMASSPVVESISTTASLARM